MKLTFKLILGVLAIALMAMTKPALAEFKLAGPPKIAMLIYTSKSDQAWSEAFDKARLRMEKTLGTKIQLVENIPENATAIRPAVELLIQKGFNIILGSAYGYSDTFKELSEKYPQVAFFNGAGTTNGPNLESFYGRTYESQYLCGMAAGAVSKTGKLGYVAANPYPLVNWAINAFTMGAREMNPSATVTVVFTGAWNDAVKERGAAEAMAGQGADVFGQHAGTAATQVFAEERGLHATGHHYDLTSVAPHATLCTSVWVWDRLLTPEVKKVEAGTWQPAPYGIFAGIKDGGTDIACCGSAVPKAAVEKIMAERQAIIDGKKQIYAGPLKDRDGKEVVAAGKVLGDADLWKMNWYVEGVVNQK